ncbi:lipoyl(octanoyl) transferase LipB [Buchnera aphidicola (Hyperomyzus lactucae)]|uniref:Octanoyltransferase n=1 Tax=Buchnera aphidicola (Hyperomyzus lactucae) TaxID=1241860 RepID=A0A4D6Y4W5_9GAMM|nr:lipoyl(octanoyl) transferase LipB [Buchnera aphidicola]QCI20991.1 lipoyl(octanoyl) transferase LipB [Buchnera aphidicola (Hyperomyzus lactucae)]
MQNKIIIFRNLGLEHWLTTVHKMNNFTILRNLYTLDEVWFVEHYPIFTQGQINKEKNIIFPNNISLVNTDRGGQITYHGPGQQIVYFLINLKRRKISIRQIIDIMQKIIIETLDHFSIKSYTKKKYPGVYVHKKKICSLGLRVKKGSTLHGLALNVNMDLTPFNYIYPCGDVNIKMTQIKDFNLSIQLMDIQKILIQKISKFLGVTMINGKDKKNK